MVCELNGAEPNEEDLDLLHVKFPGYIFHLHIPAPFLLSRCSVRKEIGMCLLYTAFRIP